MVALNEPFTGDLKGQADYQCYRQARRAGLKGDFRAFLSSRVQNIDSLVRFSDRDFPVVNLKVYRNRNYSHLLVLGFENLSDVIQQI